jgi:3-dehydroquinate dehydratase-1
VYGSAAVKEDRLMKTVMLRNVEVGAGAPKVIVPIVGKTSEDIVNRGKDLADMQIDVVEWRVDFYEDVMEIDKVLKTLAGLRAALKDKALLFTFRTKKEGGEKAIDMDLYTELNTAVANSGDVDAVDVEIFSGDDIVRKNIDAIHAAGKVVVGSNHDFDKTPSQSDLVYRLRKMQDMGADIPKIAVMPRNKKDVLTLLAATEEMTHFADRPIITMSMSATGVISRLCGEVFGSAMTFGAVGQVSAPGQIPVEQLSMCLQILHNAL